MPAPYYSSNSMPPPSSNSSYPMTRNYMGRGRGYWMPPSPRHYYREEMYERRPQRIVGSAMDDSHKNPNKVFVGGLSIDTNTWRLRSYMRQFGKIVDVAVLQNKFTGKSRCFGFCSFADEESVNKCMEQKHKIDGVPVEIRRALPKSETSQIQYSEEDQNCKIFVGGIPLHATEAQLAEHFEQFGKLKSVMLMYDKLTHKQRGFAFVTYETPENAERAVGEHQFLDSTIETKKAEPRDVAPVSRSRHGSHHFPYRPNGYYNGDMDYRSPYGYGHGPYSDNRYGGPGMYEGEMGGGHGAGSMYEGGRGGMNDGGVQDYGYGNYYDVPIRYSTPYDGDRRAAVPGGGSGAYRSWKHNVPGGSRTHPY